MKNHLFTMLLTFSLIFAVFAGLTGCETEASSSSSSEANLIMIQAELSSVKTDWQVGEKFDTSGLIVYGFYNNGSSKIISGYTTEPENGHVFTQADLSLSENLGYWLTIKYGKFLFSQPLTILEAGEAAFSLEVTPPSTTEYAYGQPLDLSGLSVTAVYKNGERKTITDYECYPSDKTELNRIGTQTVSVSYGGVSASFTITVAAPDGNKCSSYFWGKWVRMDTGKMYEVLETAVKYGRETYKILSSSDDEIVVDTLGTFGKEKVDPGKTPSDKIIVNEDGIPFFRYGGTNLEYSLKVVGFSDSAAGDKVAEGVSSRAVSSVGLKGLKGKGKSSTYTSFETEEKETDNDGVLKLTAPTVGDAQTVTIEKSDGGLVVVPNIMITNTGDFMGTVAIVEENQYNLKVTGEIDESEKDNGYLFGNNSKEYTMTITIENISDVKCKASEYSITPENSLLSVEAYGQTDEEKFNNATKGTISTMPEHGSKKLKVKLSFGNITKPYIDTGLNVSIKNPKLNSDGKLLYDGNDKIIYQEWTDYIPLRFYRGLIPITVAAKSRDNDQAALNGFIIYPDGNNQFFTVASGKQEVLLVPTFGDDKKYLLAFSGATVTQQLSESTEIFYTVSPGSPTVLPVDLLVGVETMYFGGENHSESDAVSIDKPFEAYLCEGETDYWIINGESTEIFAPGNKNYCTVSFISQYGKPTPHSSFFIPEGNTVEEKQIPTIEHRGMEFLGWYASDGTKLVPFYTVRKNMEFTARWQIADYEITYELGESIGTEDKAVNSSANPSSYRITSDTIILADPSRSFYKFEGWYTDSSFSEENKITEIPSGSTGEITLYAKWTPISYSLKLHAAGGTLASGELTAFGIRKGEEDNVYENDIYTLKYTYETKADLPSLKKIHYSFAGWYESEEEAQEKPTDSSVTQISGNYGDLELYAGWTVGTYKIHYENDACSENDPRNKTTFTYETETFDIYPPLPRNGYEFDGWYTTYGENFDPETKVTKIEKGTDEDIWLYRRWNLLTFKVDYVLGSSKAKNAESNPTEYTIEDGGESKEIVLADPIFGNHRFLGWDVVYHDSYSGDFKIEDYTKIPVTDCTDITLYAKWDIESFDITYDFNLPEGRERFVVNPEENPTSYTEEDEELTILDASCPGYQFDGWHMENQSGEVVSKLNPSLAKNIKLVASWTIIEYEIEYVLGGGTNHPDNRTKYTVEDTVGSSPLYIFDAERDYYRFDYWRNENFGSVSKIEQNATGKLKLTAVWVPFAYSIIYNLNGGTNASGNPAYFTVESEKITLLDASRENFTFEGWYTDSEFTESSKITEIPAGSHDPIAIFAKWEKVYGSAGGITVSAPTETDISGLSAPTVTNNSDGSKTITFTVPSDYGFSNYKWYADDSTTPIATGSTCTINTAITSLRGGEHLIILEATKGGRLYSATWEFEFVK